MLDKTEFIYDFLLAYDFPKATITRLKKGDYNKSRNADVDNKDNQEILWKKYLFSLKKIIKRFNRISTNEKAKIGKLFRKLRKS